MLQRIGVKMDYNRKLRVLNVFDIDGTLFHTDARVIVQKKDGSHVKELEHGEFNTHILDSDHRYDFTQFRDGVLFRQTSKPIDNILNQAKHIVNTQNELSHTILLTARADFNDHDEFIQTFRDHGFPIDKVYVERAGNLNNIAPNSKPNINKAVVLKKYIMSNNYDRIKIWDDSKSNLDTLVKLVKFNKKVDIIGYLINQSYKVVQYNSSLSESFNIYVPPESLNIERALMPQITSNNREEFLKHLSSKGITHTKTTMLPSEMKATQSEFNTDIVSNIMNTKPKMHPTIVSNDHYILDGHHRWLANLNTNKNKEVPVIKIDTGILSLLHHAKNFDGVEYRTLHSSIKQMKNVIKESQKLKKYK